MFNKNKILLLLVIISTLLLITACSIESDDANYENVVDSVKEPDNNKLLVEGTFETSEMIELTEISEDTLSKYEKAPKLYISNDIVQFGELYSTEPDFKSRYINYESLVNMNNLELEGQLEVEEGPVLTVSDGQFFYQNIFVVDEENIALVNDGILFKMNKVSDDIPENLVEDNSSKNIVDVETEDSEDTEDVDNEFALILGLKSPKKDSLDNTYHDYYSVLIHRDNDLNYSVYGIKNIFVPSKNGVFLAGIDHILMNDTYNDMFFYEPINVETEVEHIDLGDGSSNQILYMGNGFLNIETKEYDSAYRKYRLYKLSRLENEESLSITDIAREDGLKSFIEDTAKTINKNNLDAQAVDLIDIYNLGMTRNKGKWDFKSNLIIEDANQMLVIDYILDIVPTVNVANYNLSIPYEDIQTKFPGVIDAYTSPAGDFLVIQKPQELIAYTIDNGIIGDEELFSVNIGENDRIIMAEWVNGALVQEWIDLFINQERIPLQTMD